MFKVTWLVHVEQNFKARKNYSEPKAFYSQRQRIHKLGEFLDFLYLESLIARYSWSGSQLILEKSSYSVIW